MSFVKVGKIADVPIGALRMYEVASRDIVVCNFGGDLYALDNLCTHEEANLDEGELVGCEIECPRHGARFDVKSGAVTAPPAFIQLETFTVRVIGDEFEVNI